MMVYDAPVAVSSVIIDWADRAVRRWLWPLVRLWSVRRLRRESDCSRPVVLRLLGSLPRQTVVRLDDGDLVRVVDLEREVHDRGLVRRIQENEMARLFGLVGKPSSRSWPRSTRPNLWRPE